MTDFLYAVVGDDFGDHEFRSIYDQAEINDVWCPRCGSTRTKYDHGDDDCSPGEEVKYPTVYCKACKLCVTLDLPPNPSLKDVKERGTRIPKEFILTFNISKEIAEDITFTNSHIYKLSFHH